MGGDAHERSQHVHSRANVPEEDSEIVTIEHSTSNTQGRNTHTDLASHLQTAAGDQEKTSVGQEKHAQTVHRCCVAATRMARASRCIAPDYSIGYLMTSGDIIFHRSSRIQPA